MRGVSTPKHSDKEHSACPRDILMNFVGKVGVEFGYTVGHLFTVLEILRQEDTEFKGPVWTA